MAHEPERLRERQEYVVAVCLCRTCPTYPAGGDDHIAYCFPPLGRSKRKLEERECRCPQCPVYREMGYTHLFFCARGPEHEQKGKVDSVKGGASGPHQDL